MKLNPSAPARHWSWRWKGCRSAAHARAVLAAADLADAAGAAEPVEPTTLPGVADSVEPTALLGAVDLVTPAGPTRSPDAEGQAAAGAGCLAARALPFRRRMSRKFRQTGRPATLTFAWPTTWSRPSRSGPSPLSPTPAAIPARPISRSPLPARTARSRQPPMVNWPHCRRSPARRNNCGGSINSPTARGASCPSQIPKKRLLSPPSAAVRQHWKNSIPTATGNAGCSRSREHRQATGINVLNRKFNQASYMIKSRDILKSALALLVASLWCQEAAAQRGAGGGTTAPSPLHAPDSPQKAPDAEGFLPRWLILEPINIGNQQTENASKAAVKVEYFPNQLTVMPHDGDKVTVGSQELTWHALDTTVYNRSEERRVGKEWRSRW